MKYIKTLLFSITICAALAAQAQQYRPTDKGSEVSFSIVNHLLGSSTVTGHFEGLTGAITFDPNNLATASFNVSVDINTISTGIGMRDKDLKKEKFFNYDKYKDITIKSTSVTKGTTPNVYILHGQLTIKGTTHAISLPFSATPSSGGIMFRGAFKINRKDYKVGENENKISDELTVSLSVNAVKR